MHLPEINSNSVCLVPPPLLQTRILYSILPLLNPFASLLKNWKDVPAEDMEKAVHELLKSTIMKHKRVIFNGNGYTDEWVEEAEKRGLYNLKTTPDALPMFISDKNVALLTGHRIFTKEELHSRYEIWLENYVKTIHIESNTMAEMVRKDLMPGVLSYMEQIANTASLKKIRSCRHFCCRRSCTFEKIDGTSGKDDGRSYCIKG